MDEYMSADEDLEPKRLLSRESIYTEGDIQL